MEKMAVLGPYGTHSEAAAEYLSAHSEARELVVYPDIYTAIQTVIEGGTESALIPVENSLEGTVNITLDRLARSDTLTVRRELIWPVHNYLMAKAATEGIRRILSHPQPISQCRQYLLDHYRDAEVVKVASTARAAELVGAEPPESGWATICTERAGKRSGLTVIAKDIQDNMANETRFFEIVRRGGGERTDAVKKLVICQMDGQKPGALYEVLKEFAERGINMTRIESRPARTELGTYIFFFDLDLGADEAALAASLAAVRQKTIWLKDLGSFPVLHAGQKG